MLLLSPVLSKLNTLYVNYNSIDQNLEIEKITCARELLFADPHELSSVPTLLCAQRWPGHFACLRARHQQLRGQSGPIPLWAGAVTHTPALQACGC